MVMMTVQWSPKDIRKAWWRPFTETDKVSFLSVTTRREKNPPASDLFVKEERRATYSLDLIFCVIMLFLVGGYIKQ